MTLIPAASNLAVFSSSKCVDVITNCGSKLIIFSISGFLNVPIDSILDTSSG